MIFFKERDDKVDCEVYMVVNMLKANSGGLGRAVCNRVNMLLEQGIQVEILSTIFNKNVNFVRRELLTSKRLSEHAKLRNMYEELAGDKMGADDSLVSFIDHRPYIHHPIMEKGFVYEQGDKPNTYRLYKDGLYLKYKCYDKEGRLQFIDYFNENRNRIKKETFDEKGYMNRIEYMDFRNNKPNTICFFNQNGCCYLSKWLNSITGDTTKINLFENNGNSMKEFKGEDELKKYWIERFVIKYDVNPIIISDIRDFDALITSLEHKGLKRIAFMHNNHFESPYVYGSQIKSHQMNLLNIANKFNAIVCLTEHQRRDVIGQFGEKTKYTVISHYAPLIKYDESKREEFTVISLSRYDRFKNLDHVILSFQSVLRIFPQAKLELWGMGPEENNLKELITKLELNKSVLLKGFSSNPIENFERATVSVLASKQEGFGLVITESMAAGAPVISYDFLYGPKEIITNGVDGIVVEENNPEHLANCIINLFRDPDRVKQMSREARKITRKYSYERYSSLWVELLREMVMDK